MRRVYAILISGAFVYMLFSFLGVLPPFGSVDLSTRVSEGYLLKNVNSQDSSKWIEGSGKFSVDKRKVYGVRDAEDGSANVVTSVVVDYRSFDTLGEVTVLFTAALGVGIILGGPLRKSYNVESNFVLRTSTGVLLPLIMMFGAYIFIHGHLTPGGGFPGGTIIAASILLLYLSNEKFKLSKISTGLIEGSMGGGYVIAGFLGLIIGGYFLFNFLPTGTVGKLVSSGIIPIVYVLIGFKVGAELSGVITDLYSEKEG